MAGRFPIRSGMTIADEPVGDVNMILQVFCGGVLLEDGADGD